MNPSLDLPQNSALSNVERSDVPTDRVTAVRPLLYGAASHQGAVRPTNEDSLLVSPRLFVVADGLGRSRGGGRASALVTEVFQSLVDRTDLSAADIESALDLCQQRIVELHDETPSAATTACGVVLLDAESAGSAATDHWLVFNIGDSRVYRTTAYGRTGLTQLTADHSLVADLERAHLLSPEEARAASERHVVTKVLGSETPIEPDLQLVPVVPGERLLLCSDGLVNALDPDVVEETLALTAQPETAAERLLALSLQAGARDNVSVIVIDVAQGHGTLMHDH